MINASNLSIEEQIRYGNFPETALTLLDDAREELKKKDLDYLAEKHHAEVMDEQVYFAHNALTAINDAMKRYTTAKDLKKAISIIIENSGFEL